jgi:hypothetical protein
MSVSGACLHGRLALRASLALACWAAPAVAEAEIIKCFFTEPFLTTTYSSNANTLTIASIDDPQNPTVTPVSLQIMQPNLFELWNDKNEPVQRMELNYKGSDGMSDTVFPYDAMLLANKLRGGCVSNHLHRR